jgi:hypothetical protein
MIVRIIYLFLSISMSTEYRINKIDNMNMNIMNANKFFLFHARYLYLFFLYSNRMNYRLYYILYYII